MAWLTCDNCGRDFFAKGTKSNYKKHFCSRGCYSIGGGPRRSAKDRFYEKFIVTPTGCWEWIAGKYSNGYGSFYLDTIIKITTAHRASWIIHNGAIPDGLNVLHKCDNPPCVNPEHLFLGTLDDNNKDMATKRRSTIGEKNPAAKLKNDDVREIRLLSKQMTQVAIAERYGVSLNTITSIIVRRRWQRVE